MSYGESTAGGTEMGICFESTRQVGPFVSGYLKHGVMVRISKTIPHGSMLTIHLALPGRKRSVSTRAVAQGSVAGQQTIALANSSERERRALISLVAVAENTPDELEYKPGVLPVLIDIAAFEAEEAQAQDTPSPRPKRRPEVLAQDEVQDEIQLNVVTPIETDTQTDPALDELALERGLATLAFETTALYVRTLTELRGGGTRIRVNPTVPHGYEFSVMLPRMEELNSLVIPVTGGEVSDGCQVVQLAGLEDSVQTKLYQLMVDAFRLPGVTDSIAPDTVVTADWDAVPPVSVTAVSEPLPEAPPPVVTEPTVGAIEVADGPVALGTDDGVEGVADDGVEGATEAAPIEKEYIIREIAGTFGPMPDFGSMRFTRSWKRLEDVPTVGLWLVHFFGFLCRTTFTGLLQLNYGSKSVEMVMVEGVVENIHTTDEHFQNLLGGTLLANKVIRVQQLQQAITLAASDGLRLDKAFFQLNLVSPSDLVRGLRQMNNRLLDEALEAGSGSFRCQEWTHSPQSKGPVPVSFLHMTNHCLKGHLVQLETSDVQDRLEPLMERYPYVPDDAMDELQGMALSQKERHVIENVLNGSMVLRKAYASSALNDTQLTRLIVRVGLMGLLQFPATQQRYAVGESPEEFLTEALETLEEQHFFDRLKVHWTEHGPGIDASYQELSGAYGPAMQSQLSTLNEAELAKKVWVMIDDAYRQLCTPEGRRVARATLFDKGAITQAAEMLFQQGEMAAFRGERGEARNVFERAYDLDPQVRYTEAIETHCAGYENALPKVDDLLAP